MEYREDGRKLDFIISIFASNAEWRTKNVTIKRENTLIMSDHVKTADNIIQCLIGNTIMLLRVCFFPFCWAYLRRLVGRLFWLQSTRNHVLSNSVNVGDAFRILITMALWQTIFTHYFLSISIGERERHTHTHRMLAAWRWQYIASHLPFPSTFPRSAHYLILVLHRRTENGYTFRRKMLVVCIFFSLHLCFI